MHKLHPGAVISRRNLMTTRSQPIQLPDPTGVIHLQLRRYAGCPFCNLHLRSIVQRHQETVAVLWAAGPRCGQDEHLALAH
jgi:hypothetical protein